MQSLPVLFFVLFSLLVCIRAVDRSKFRTCQDTGFCRTYRGYQPTASQQFHIDTSSIKKTQGKLTAAIHQPHQTPLYLEVSFLQSGSVRVKVSEKTPRWQPTDLLVETSHFLSSYVEASSEQIPAAWKDKDASSYTALAFQTGTELSDNVLIVQHSPFKVELFRDGVATVVVNDRNLMHYQQTEGSQGADSIIIDEEAEEIDRHQGKEVVDYGEDGLAIYSDGTREEKKSIESHSVAAQAKGESFGGHFDSMLLGARSVGIDFSFPCASNVYGIPEHTTPLSLPTTSRGSADAQSHYSQPYRLYNLDVFEYELQETMALYGHIPLMWSHGKCGNDKTVTAGVFWFNPSETFIDVADGKHSQTGKTFKESHWISESGEIDIFLLPGPNPRELMRQYSSITGTQQLPPLFALGYHQCRWNYRDEKDVATVNAKFEELDYPYDVLWLDIEHTNGKRYFTWDKSLFPNPLEMQKNITTLGRKMVTIIDPHIKRDDGFHIHREATQKGLYIKDKTGKDFDGWCWPGSSSYLDFTNPRVREWWAEQFSLNKYEGSTLDLFTWNDMNEPSVFNGPEVSMSKDAKNLDGVEHREWHNLYGIYMQMATAQGQVQRCINSKATKLRPFVLTRAFWAGSQRFGAMWTGDNKADWGHLKISVPMLLSINMAGLSFAGADVGGFFGEASAELFTRWYQAGAFTPFFRGHAHHDTKRREPWVFGEPHTTIHRQTAMLRYTLLPLWYTVFFEAYETGVSVMRPMFLEFPEVEDSFRIDDQWMVGNSLLVKPVTDPGANSVNVYLPEVKDKCNNNVNKPLPWYDLETLRPVYAATGGNYVNVAAPLSKIPVFIKPGTILSRKMRLRRSSKLMYFDPYTLVIAPGACGQAEGLLYLDDEHTFAHEESGMFALRRFSFSGTELRSSTARTVFNPVSRSTPLIASPDFGAVNTVERIVIAGQSVAPKKVILTSNNVKTDLFFTFDESNGVLTIKKPDVRVIDDWTVSLEF